MTTRRFLNSLSAAVLLNAFVSMASADVFVLRGGGRLQGEWKNPDEPGGRSYRIRTDAGVELHLPGWQVVDHLRETSSVAEYHRLAPTFADTVSDQLRLAEWCRERGLVKQRQEHLRRVVELDPACAEAWKLLGYSEIDGKWVTKKEYFQERGYVYYRGKWRVPQEVDVMEARRQAELVEREWFSKLKSMRGQLGTEHDAEGARSIAEIRDPHAIPALAEYLRREKITRVRLIYVSALAEIRHGKAVELLVATVLNDADAEVCHECTDRLVALQPVGLAKVLAKSLKDPNNDRVNRAAYLLGRLGDQSVIPALIEALVTTHIVRNPNAGRSTATLVQPATDGNSPMTNSGAAPLGETGFSTGSGPTIAIPVQNQGVLRALGQLSGGQNFAFDQRAWVNWYAVSTRSTAPTGTLR